MNIFVDNLPEGVTESDLRKIFEPFGEVANAAVFKDRITGKSRGIGFVEMPNHAEGEAALETLNGREIGGRPLDLHEARPRTASVPGRERRRDNR